MREVLVRVERVDTRWEGLGRIKNRASVEARTAIEGEGTGR